MLLTISTTHKPATDLGYLLYKHPGKVQSVELSQGKAHIFYPEATEERCTIALLLDIDPIGLVRNSKGPSGEGFALEHYVNDRPYVASSFMSVAIAKAYATAMNGTCKDKPELVNQALPLEVSLSVLPCKGGEYFLRKLFEPLGYQVQATHHILDPHFPEWGDSRYFTVKLTHTIRLRDLLSHLYVLIPVLDNDKHYWVGEHEIEKLFDKGEGWLQTHPEREQITRKYLKNLSALTGPALAILTAEEQAEDEESVDTELPLEIIEKKKTLHEQRLTLTTEQLLKSGAKRVLDLGCGEGKLLRLLLREKQFEEILGMDVSFQSLEIAKDRLKLDRMPDKQKERIRLIQGSLLYRDKRLAGYDAAAIVEVIEHLDQPRLAAFERVVFSFAKPGTVVLTTPNAEYNQKYATLTAGTFRHADHRFEWTRAEFEVWAKNVASVYHYQVHFLPVGPEDEAVGAPSQMAVFEKMNR
jgi:3' terminal RNA ribose 2'-O-methyltransferase Hen1